MPAAAVIPAPIAYIKVVAVKKLVVETRDVVIESVCGDGVYCSTFLDSVFLGLLPSALN